MARLRSPARTAHLLLLPRVPPLSAFLASPCVLHQGSCPLSREPAQSQGVTGLLMQGPDQPPPTSPSLATQPGLGDETATCPGPGQGAMGSLRGNLPSQAPWHTADGTWAAATQPPRPALRERSLQVPSSRGNCWINTLPQCWWRWQALAGGQAAPSCFSTAKRAPASPGSAAS